MSTNAITYSETDPLGRGDITATMGVADTLGGRGSFRLPVLLESVGDRRPWVFEWLPLLATDDAQLCACRAAVAAEVERRASLHVADG